MLQQTHYIHFNANAVMDFNLQGVLGAVANPAQVYFFQQYFPNHRESLLSLLVVTQCMPLNKWMTNN